MSERSVTMRSFGVDILAGRRLPGLLPGRRSDCSRRVELTLVEREAIDARWPARGAERVIHRKRADGSFFMSVDHHQGEGYRIEAVEMGAHRVSADGSCWSAWLPPGSPWRWQKLVFAQVLPVIATLHGLAVLHGSGVVKAGRVYGIIAPSGTGKSSTASQLVARGATFFTDDVLALEVFGDDVVAHPGPQFANVHGHELEVLGLRERQRLGKALGSSDKHHLMPVGAVEPLPLGALFFLRRWATLKGIEVNPPEEPARQILGNAFVPHVRTPPRLLGQLGVGSSIAANVPLYEVDIGSDTTSRDVAAVIESVIRRT